MKNHFENGLANLEIIILSTNVIFQIHFEDRFIDFHFGATIFNSLDDLDCMIEEPQPFDKKWQSFKSNGPGLRYEIGLNIYNGNK